MSLSIQVQPEARGRVRVRLAGRLDTATHEQFERAVEPLLTPALKAMVLDLAGLDYIGSMGLRAILECRSFLQKHKRPFLVVAVTPPVAKVFELADILPKTDIFNDQDEADQFLDAVQRRERLEHEDVSD